MVSISNGESGSSARGKLNNLFPVIETAANQTSNNVTLAAGQLGVESDTGKFKFGDGSTAWTSLAYALGAAAFSNDYGDLANLPSLFDGDGANLTGTISVNRFNGGTGASSSTYLRGDGTWATPSGSGDVSKVGTPVDNQVAVWTGDGTAEGTSGLTYNGTAFGVTGNITVSGTVDGRDVAADGAVIDGLATVASTGSYGDLIDAPTISLPSALADTAATTSDTVAYEQSSTLVGRSWGNLISDLSIITSSDAASTSAAGVVELATTAETTTGTDTARAVTPDGLAGSVYGQEVVTVCLFNDSEDVATGNGAGDQLFRVPAKLNGWNLVGVAAYVQTAGTTGTTDIQIANVTQAADMLTTVMTIDSTETDTATAATPGVIDTANDDVATGDKIRFDVDAVSTTAPKGLWVEMTFQAP